ncbi:MAG: triphosphoribosyl-dephospho-CoA synthase [Methanobacterium sp.]|nr:triphosphoribosyl-dephospho-CoA synthase [Methanobacterium sp.]
MDPDLIASIAQIASVLEVSGHPKPGNVHRTQDFEDMMFEDFLISGIVIGDTIKKSAQRASKCSDKKDLHKIRLGELINEAVLITNSWVENNTNLGIIMLLTPIAAAAGLTEDFNDLQDNIHEIMLNTTSADAVNLYDAINIAEAGGMGEQKDLDVGSEEAKEELIEKEINMFQVLDISSTWDALAYELTHKMPVSFNLGHPTYKRLKKEYGNNKATVQTFLTILSEKPDTLISRKYDETISRRVSFDAKVILDKGGILTEEGRYLLEKYDQDMMEKKYNPGTTADLTASSLMIALLEEKWI